MSENKFIAQLKGKAAPGSVLEVQDKGSKTSFANMPSGTSDAIVTYSDKRNNATAVLKGAMNWKVNGSTLSVANPAGDGSDYTGQTAVAGISDQQGNNLWINASYIVPADGLFLTKNTKWVLKLCGDNLIVNGGDTAEFTVLITAGNSTIITKKFYVGEQANQFCKELVIDFAESNTSTVKLEQGDTITLKLLSDIPNASARIYQGMTTLTLLQRAVDAENVISKDGSYEDVWEEINKKVNIDGSSTMTGPLKMRASVSFQCAIAPYWDGVGFYKLNDDDSVTLLASMEATDGFLPYASNTYNMGSSAHKWKNLYLGGKAYVSTLNNGADISVPTTTGTMALTSDIPDISNLANKDLSNLTTTGANIGNWSSNVTNCISELPQHINISINASNQLELASGSTVYLGGSTSVPISTTIKQTATTYNTGKYFIATNPAGTTIEVAGFSSAVSAASNPETAYIMWFNTTDGKPYINGSDGTAREISFPIAIASFTNGTGWSKVEQVFNGIGYIGSTVFALPGLEYLMPNGRNNDGSLKNASFSLSQIRYTTVSSSANGTISLGINDSGVMTRDYLSLCVTQDEEPTAVTNLLWYCPKLNTLQQYVSGAWADRKRCFLGTIHATSGKIDELNQKTVFKAVDYSNTAFIAHQAMPSGKYSDLTLGASGSTYTAPADGYYYLRKSGTAQNQYIYMSGGGLAQDVFCPLSNGGTRSIWLPVKNRTVVTVSYNADGATSAFRFIFAEGVNQ